MTTQQPILFTRSNGQPGWYFPELDRVIPVVRGGDGETDPPDDPPKKDDPPGKVDKTFTQEEVNARAAQEKDQGRRAAEESIAKQLGVTIDEAKTIISNAKAADDKQKTEAQRAREAADAEKAEAEKEKTEAAKERHETKLERKLVRAGVDADNDKRLTRAIRTMDVAVGADDAVIDAAITELKKEEPGWFGSTDDGKGSGKKPPPSDPKGGPPKPKVNEDAFSRGAERAKQQGSGREYTFMKT